MLAATAGPVLAASPSDPEWQAFKQRYVRSDGRVIDSGNAEITHSESQGFGMLFAEYFGDRPVFDSIRVWTERALRWKGASLHAWKWARDLDAPVPDWNNATDGDLLIAWALERAARRWNDPEYAADARRIAIDVRRLLSTRDGGGRLVLLPAFDGFDRDGGTTLNLSYYVVPALLALQRVDPSPVWQELVDDGLELIEASRFGRWRLPPDWLHVGPGGAVESAVKWPARFGFDAVRIPLYLVWSGLGTQSLLEPFGRFWQSTATPDGPLAWVSLEDDGESPYRAPTGAGAVAALVLSRLGDTRPVPRTNASNASEDYYAASLRMMARIAAEEVSHLRP